jgi:predicted nucleic acid-binding protein
MKLKLDACSLILSQKLDVIPRLHDTFGTIFITTAVNEEVINQKKNPRSGKSIENFVAQGIIKNVIPRGILISSLGQGESETLAETKTEIDKGEEAIYVTDDKKAMKEAIRLGLDVLGLDSLLVELVLLDKITEDEFDTLLTALDKIHKLDLIRITELRRFVRLLKNRKNGE